MTGQPKNAAMSALAPVRPSDLPDAVEKAHGAFRDDEVRTRKGLGRDGREQRRPHGEAVEIEARLAGRRRVEGRVDIVGPAFDAADVDAAPAKRALKAQLDVVLPAPERGAATRRPGARLTARLPP